MDPAMKVEWNALLPAPAKINLFLHVVGRRMDGYHLLQTAFRFLDHGDHLSFMPREDDRIILDHPLPGVPADRDLTVRAAMALRTATGCTAGVSIHLHKRLPLGGGLGGGSSDAATTLLALNQLWGCRLSRADLQVIGLGLGADVPVFIHGHSAFAEGVGERLSDISPPPAWYLVLEPPVAVPTTEIFADPDLCRNTPAITMVAWQPGFGANDLEPVACRLYPEVKTHLEWLRQWGAARMSGSGACCFAEFGDEMAARAIFDRLPPGMHGFVAQGLDVHPLAQSFG
jgi:4-diphosphocytidyl-2-C-methyl-D-erythritol kinase